MNTAGRLDVLFSTMTSVETDMWALVAKRFEAEGYSTAFLVFDESARRPLERLGLTCFSAFELLARHPYERWEGDMLKQRLAAFHITRVRDLFIHEKLGYGRPDEGALFRKTLHYLQALDALFAGRQIGCVFQEMGGFAATNAVYYAARRRGIEHVFYEPAAVPKRLVLTRNGFYADMPPEIIRARPLDGARQQGAAYIDAYLNRPEAVVPAKDRHSFKDMTPSRMFNAFNARRLTSKLYRKYVSGEREEFDEVGFVVRKNLLKLARRAALSRHYSVPAAGEGPYVYYPFHVPHDVQLSVRSKLFYFQEAFVEYLSRILPWGYRLYVKEHPAAIGGHSLRLLTRLLKTHPNIKLIHPRESSFALIRDAALVVTVNSKVGFEAIMQGRRVLVVGDAFYKGKGLTVDVDSLNTLDRALLGALTGTAPSRDQIVDFVARIFTWSYPCELFDSSPENVDLAFGSLRSYLGQQEWWQEPVAAGAL